MSTKNKFSYKKKISVKPYSNSNKININIKLQDTKKKQKKKLVKKKEKETEKEKIKNLINIPSYNTLSSQYAFGGLLARDALGNLLSDKKDKNITNGINKSNNNTITKKEKNKVIDVEESNLKTKYKRKIEDYMIDNDITSGDFYIINNKIYQTEEEAQDHADRKKIDKSIKRVTIRNIPEPTPSYTLRPIFQPVNLESTSRFTSPSLRRETTFYSPDVNTIETQTETKDYQSEGIQAEALTFEDDTQTDIKEYGVSETQTQQDLRQIETQTEPNLRVIETQTDIKKYQDNGNEGGNVIYDENETQTEKKEYQNNENQTDNKVYGENETQTEKAKESQTQTQTYKKKKMNISLDTFEKNKMLSDSLEKYIMNQNYDVNFPSDDVKFYIHLDEDTYRYFISENEEEMQNHIDYYGLNPSYGYIKAKSLRKLLKTSDLRPDMLDQIEEHGNQSYQLPTNLLNVNLQEINNLESPNLEPVGQYNTPIINTVKGGNSDDDNQPSSSKGMTDQEIKEKAQGMTMDRDEYGKGIPSQEKDKVDQDWETFMADTVVERDGKYSYDCPVPGCEFKKTYEDKTRAYRGITSHIRFTKDKEHEDKANAISTVTDLYKTEKDIEDDEEERKRRGIMERKRNVTQILDTLKLRKQVDPSKDEVLKDYIKEGKGNVMSVITHIGNSYKKDDKSSKIEKLKSLLNIS